MRPVLCNALGPVLKHGRWPEYFAEALLIYAAEASAHALVVQHIRGVQVIREIQVLLLDRPHLLGQCGSLASSLALAIHDNRGVCMTCV